MLIQVSLLHGVLTLDQPEISVLLLPMVQVCYTTRGRCTSDLLAQEIKMYLHHHNWCWVLSSWVVESTGKAVSHYLAGWLTVICVSVQLVCPLREFLVPEGTLSQPLEAPWNLVNSPGFFSASNCSFLYVLICFNNYRMQWKGRKNGRVRRERMEDKEVHVIKQWNTHNLHTSSYVWFIPSQFLLPSLPRTFLWAKV